MSKEERCYAIPVGRALSLVLGAEGQRSVSLFRHGTLEVKFGSPLVPNVQTPHAQDELYIVVRGYGHLFHDGKKDPCGPGDLLFVAAGTEHHFEEFTEDFTVWVIFYGPQGGELPAQRASA